MRIFCSFCGGILGLFERDIHAKCAKLVLDPKSGVLADHYQYGKRLPGQERS